MRPSTHIKQIEKLSLAAYLTANTSHKTVADRGSSRNRGRLERSFVDFQIQTKPQNVAFNCNYWIVL